jgi:hypothetical protein
VVDNAVDIGAYEFPSPTVTMLPATNVTATSATLNASVDGHGRDTSNTFTYGRAAVNDNILDAINLPGSSTAQDVNAPISGLQPGTTYLYQLCSVAATAGCGAVASFKTLPLAPVISGSKALAIKQTSAILAGSVNAGNGVTNAHFEFGQTRVLWLVVETDPAGAEADDRSGQRSGDEVEARRPLPRATRRQEPGGHRQRSRLHVHDPRIKRVHDRLEEAQQTRDDHAEAHAAKPRTRGCECSDRARRLRESASNVEERSDDHLADQAGR